MNTLNSVAFAYFSNDEFLGWYGGTFGGCSTTPKLYNDSEHQCDVIRKNFQNKLKSVNESSLNEELPKAGNLLQTIGLLKFSSEDELRGKDVELRTVETPFYDGKGPDGWVFADYSKVREWATNEPTEFKNTLTEYKL
jgi:hypothetical protein